MFARSLVVIVMCPRIESERERGHREAAVLQFANSQYPSAGRDNNYKGHFNNMPGVALCACDAPI